MVVMMTKWAAHEAMAASRQRLSSALVKIGRADLAERVMEGVQLGKDLRGEILCHGADV